MAQLTVYASASPYYSSYRDNGHNTWSNLHDQTNANNYGQGVRIRTYDYENDLFSEIARGIMVFDTSALPDACTITSAVLSLYGTGKSDDLQITPTINIFNLTSATYPASYSACGTTDYCDTAITYAGWSTSGYNDFTLNATGEAAISKTGNTLICAREATYDEPNSAPDPGGDGESEFAYDLVTNKPRLVITYYEGTSTAVPTTTAAPGSTTAATTVLPITTEAPSWLQGWDKRIPFWVESARVDADVTNFSVALFINSSAGINNTDVTCIFDELTPYWNRIAITEDDGLTQCYVEKIKWDEQNEQGILYFKAPKLHSNYDEKFYLYYDVEKPDNTTYVGATTSTPAQNVWDSNYLAVYHLNEEGDGTANEFKDSTSNAYHGEAGSSTRAPVRTTGKVHYGQQFDGLDDYIKIDDLAGTYQYFTLEATVNPSVIEQRGIMALVGSYLYSWEAGLQYFTTATRFKHFNDAVLGDSTVPAVDTWAYYASSRGASQAKLYKDGALKKTGASDSSTKTISYVRLGRQSWPNSNLFSGIMDEVRISNIQRSDAWIKASYYSLWDDLVYWGAESAPNTVPPTTTEDPATTTAGPTSTAAPTTPPTTTAPTTAAPTTAAPTSTALVTTTEEPPVGTTNLQTLREKIARAGGVYDEDTVTTAIAANTSVVCSRLAGRYPNDDDLNGKWIYITSGNNDNVERIISDYTASTGAITVNGANLTSDGAALATFELHTFRPTDFTQAVNETCEEEFDRVYQELEDTTTFTAKNQTVYNVPSDITEVFKIYEENYLNPEFDENILYEEGASVNFEDWTVSTYPDGAGTPTNITCSQYGTTDQQSNWVPPQYGDYLMKCVSSSSAGNVPWNITTQGTYAGQLLSLSVPFYFYDSSATEEWRIEINDGVGFTRSDYHGGTGWELMEVQHEVDPSTSALNVYIRSAGNTKVGFAGHIILSRSEYYLSKAWKPLSGWHVFNDKIWFDREPTANKFLRVIGKAVMSTVSADTDRIETSDPEIWIIVWGALRYLWRAQEQKHFGSGENPFTAQVNRCEYELNRARQRYGNATPTIVRTPYM